MPWLLKKFITTVLTIWQNQNFGRSVTHHGPCQIEQNDTVNQHLIFLTEKCHEKTT